MSRHDVAVLTLRAFALYAWFQAFQFLSVAATAMVMYSRVTQPGVTTFNHLGDSYLITAGFYILVGLFLFIRSRELASWLLPLPSAERAEELPPHPLGVASAAFAVIGLVFFLSAVPTLIRYGTTYARMENPKEMQQLLSRDIPQIAGSAAQLILGFFLFLKSRTFATTWWRKQQPATVAPNA